MYIFCTVLFFLVRYSLSEIQFQARYCDNAAITQIEGDIKWNNTQNFGCNNAENYVEAEQVTNNKSTNTLRFSRLNFSIPINSTVTSVSVSVTRKKTRSGQFVIDSFVSLSKGAVDFPTTGFEWDTALETVTYTNSSWNQFTPSFVNSEDFAFLLQATNWGPQVTSLQIYCMIVNVTFNDDTPLSSTSSSNHMTTSYQATIGVNQCVDKDDCLEITKPVSIEGDFRINAETIVFSANSYEVAPLVVSGLLSIPPNTQLLLRLSENFSEKDTIPLIQYGNRSGEFSQIVIDMQDDSENKNCQFDSKPNFDDTEGKFEVLVTSNCKSNSVIIIAVTGTVVFVATTVTCAILSTLCQRRKNRSSERKSQMIGALSMENSRTSFHSLIYNDSPEKRQFVEFLKKDRSVHYLHFLEDVAEFKKLKDEELSAKAATIFNIFIRQTGSKSIIIESKIIEEISSAIEKNQIQRKLFDAAELQVYELLRSDSFRRFAVLNPQ